MISVSQAQKIIKDNITALPAVATPLCNAAGKILAQDIYSTIDIPAFPQSSMDGYAINYNGWQQHKQLEIVGEMAAGDDKEISIQPHQAARIFTGAPVPAGADTIIMQEKVKRENNLLTIEDNSLQAGNSLRLKGSEIKDGELAMAKGSLLSPAAIGFLAGIGITELQVIPNPKITIIVTGKELQDPGKPLAYGQVYESNSLTLKAALQPFSITGATVIKADDDINILTRLLRQALEASNMVLLTGGVSVGDYDFVLQAAANNNIETLFHKIKQRPGKPLFMGKKADKIIFGLPGNPSSVLTCFYEYVALALQLLTGKKTGLQTLHVPLESSFKKAIPLTQFLKGYYDGSKVVYLGAQESFRLSSFALSNCLIKIPENQIECPAGELVEIHLLPV